MVDIIKGGKRLATHAALAAGSAASAVTGANAAVPADIDHHAPSDNIQLAQADPRDQYRNAPSPKRGGGNGMGSHIGNLLMGAAGGYLMYPDDPEAGAKWGLGNALSNWQMQREQEAWSDSYTARERENYVWYSDVERLYRAEDNQYYYELAGQEQARQHVNLQHQGNMLMLVNDYGEALQYFVPTSQIGADGNRQYVPVTQQMGNDINEIYAMVESGAVWTGTGFAKPRPPQVNYKVEYEQPRVNQPPAPPPTSGTAPPNGAIYDPNALNGKGGWVYPSSPSEPPPAPSVSNGSANVQVNVGVDENGRITGPRR